MLLCAKYATALLTTCTVLTLYITTTTVQIQQNTLKTLILSQKDDNHQVDEPYEAYNSSPVKNIVAYSLLKQIEIEGEDVNCEKIKIIEKDTVNTHDSASNNNYESYELNNSINSDFNKWIQVPNTKLSVFSAYLDDRLLPYRYIRIVGMIQGTWNESLYCQLKNDVETLKWDVVKAKITPIWSENWHTNEEIYKNPVLVSCQIPIHNTSNNSNIITKLYLSSTPCTVNTHKHNSILVNNNSKLGNVKNKQKKKAKVKHVKFLMANAKNSYTNIQPNISVGICVKPLNFAEDITEALAKWLVLNKILGVNYIYIYVNRIHNSTYKFLEWLSKFDDSLKVVYYKDLSNLNYKEGTTSNRNYNDDRIISDDPASTLWQKRKNELVFYNDCFYKNIQTVDFVIPLDIDEIILPKKHKTYSQLLNYITQSNPALLENYASFSVQNAYFLSPKKIYKPNDFFSTLTRTSFSPKFQSGKSFISTKSSLTVFNHYALKELRPGVRKTYFLPIELAQMNHYRKNCPTEIFSECTNFSNSKKYFVDDSVMKFYKEFNVLYAKIMNEYTSQRL